MIPNLLKFQVQSIQFSEQVALEDVRKMITAALSDGSKPEIVVQRMGAHNLFNYYTEKIRRGEESMTLEVVAYCGNVSFFDGTSGNQVDVIQARRSTGSTLKPFLYYSMLNEGEILPWTLVPDAPIYLKDFTPTNFSEHFEGAVPAGDAVARLLNVPLVFTHIIWTKTEKLKLLWRK